MSSTSQTYGQATTAVLNLEDRLTDLRKHIVRRKFLEAKSDIDTMQRHLNHLRCCIKLLAKPSRIRWKVRDDLLGWCELAVGLAAGWVLTFLYYTQERGVFVFGLIVAGLLAVLAYVGKEL